MHWLFRIQSAALSAAGFLIFWTIILLVYTSKRHVSSTTSSIAVLEVPDVTGVLVAEGFTLSDDARAEFPLHDGGLLRVGCPASITAAAPPTVFLINGSNPCGDLTAVLGTLRRNDILAVEAASEQFVASVEVAVNEHLRRFRPRKQVALVLFLPDQFDKLEVEAATNPTTQFQFFPPGKGSYKAPYWLMLMGVLGAALVGFVLLTGGLYLAGCKNSYPGESFSRDFRSHHSKWIPVYGFAGFILPLMIVYTVCSLIKLSLGALFRFINTGTCTCIPPSQASGRVVVLSEADLDDCLERLPEGIQWTELTEKASCTICVQDCAVGKKMLELGCKHKFHHDCILPWLQKSESCPLCRTPVQAFEFPLDIPGEGSGLEMPEAVEDDGTELSWVGGSDGAAAQTTTAWGSGSEGRASGAGSPVDVVIDMARPPSRPSSMRIEVQEADSHTPAPTQEPQPQAAPVAEIPDLDPTPIRVASLDV